MPALSKLSFNRVTYDGSTIAIFIFHPNSGLSFFFVTFAGDSGQYIKVNPIINDYYYPGIVKANNGILYVSGLANRVNVIPLVRAINCSVSEITQEEFDSVTGATIIYDK